MGLGLIASPAAAAPFAYVVNSGGIHGNVSVIDTATNPPSVVATIPVVDATAVALTPDGKHAYVANAASHNMSVIATATNTVVATVPVGNLPVGVAVTPDGKHAYVTNTGSVYVSVIDTTANTVVATITLPLSSVSYGVAVTPDSKHAYVTSMSGEDGSSNVWVIDTGTNTVETTIPAGNFPYGVVVSPDGKHA
jgi:YVTN family beta-propeller protein